MIKRRSEKRAKQEREYIKENKIYLEEHPYCEAKVQCHGMLSSQVHHKKGRIGDLLLNKEFWLPVCGQCHDWIENNPLEAKEKGLSLSRLSK